MCATGVPVPGDRRRVECGPTRRADGTTHKYEEDRILSGPASSAPSESAMMVGVVLCDGDVRPPIKRRQARASYEAKHGA